uniref:Uncharacterized protein n=1 Tax=Fagus sylvatica TaxID=28930 RepID=A0A2N9EV97_FAGSY
MEPPRVEPPRFGQSRVEPPRVEPPRIEQTRMEPPRVEPPRFEQPRMEPPRVEPPRFEQPRMEPPRVEPPRFEQPRMEPPRVEPPRFEQPRMEPPRVEPPRFKQSRMEQPRQPETGFRVEPPQRCGPIRNEPYREQFRFEQPYEFRNEPPRNEPYRPPQNRRNRFGYQNNDRQRNDYDGQDRNAYNIPEGEAFDRGIDLEERNIRVEPNPRLAQGQDLRDQILEVIDQALGPGEDEKTALEHIFRFTVQCGEYSNNGNGKLRNVVQDKIDRNVLKFPEVPQESMAIDADPFPFVDVNTTSVDFSSLIPNKNLCFKTNKSKVNLLQVFCPQGKQLVQATQEMSNLRIERSIASDRNNSAKTNGRNTSIQCNNVHVDKRKSVAYPIEQPIFSYKEILRKEPPKVSLEDKEDDTICERCNHILAKFFSKTKREDSKNPQEAEIDSMEVITGAEALEYLQGPYARKEDTIGVTTKDIATPTMNGAGHKVQSTKMLSQKWNSRKSKPHRRQYGPKRANWCRFGLAERKEARMGRKEAEDNLIEAEQPQETSIKSVQGNATEDTEEIKGIEDTEDMDDIENIEDVEDLEGFGNIEGVENFENIEGIDDIEVEEVDDVEEMEGLEAMECIETDIQTGKQKIDSQKPKNGKTLSCNAITLPREFMATT